MRSISVLAYILLFLALWPTPSMAQTVSDSEDVVIAFFKTAGTPPNFQTLAKTSKDYYLTPVGRQQAFLAKEQARLQQAYNNYDPQNGLLTIRTMSNIKLYAVQENEDAINYGMTISFGKDDALFFPYELGNYNIAVLPQKMGSRFDQNLARQQYELIKQTFKGRDEGQLPLYVQLKPVKAYLDQPYRIGGLDQWALITDVAGLMITDTKNTRLWTYSADWYVSPVTEELRDLYSEQVEDKQEEMATENPVLNSR